jgi:predicted P-loop ATPase
MFKHELMPTIEERRGKPRLNVRTDEIVLGDDVLSMDDVDSIYLEFCSDKEDWPKLDTEKAIVKLARQNKFDPIADYLNDLRDHVPLPMEQWKRLDKWLLGIDDPVAADFLPSYLVSAVARVLLPGCEARATPVLISRQQHIGKSALGKILFSKDFYVVGLEDFGKDARMRCHRGWGVELAELDGVTRRADVAALKSFLTEEIDWFRKPYGKSVEAFERRHVFFGTSNEPPLRDVTGNTRFVCIELPGEKLPLKWVESNRNAIWARAVEQYASGFDWTEVTDGQRQARDERNEQHRAIDPWSELIEDELLINSAHNGFITFAELYKLLDIPSERQGPTASRRIRMICESFGWFYGVHKVEKAKTTMRGFKRK